MKQWTLVTPLRFLRGILRALVLTATALAILLAGAIGGLVPVALLNRLGMGMGVLALLFGSIGGLVGVVGAYIVGDRLNDRIRRVRAPIGTVSVGADGIRWRRFGRTHFAGWAAVLGIEQRASEVVLELADRTPVTLAVQESGALAMAAEQAQQRYREGAPPDVLAALDLAGASVAEWLERARKLLERGSYREANVGEESLVRIATDPRAPAAQRIGSAAALSSASDDARSRVRVAIDETADPAIANALEDALDGRKDDRAMRAVLTRGR